ncbi:sulfide/dihydroorotate dehydrogenase-like FAD/NAD-binding protein, partial [archaeon]
KSILEKRGDQINRVIVIGPTIMMKIAAEITRPLKIKTIASLNPIMVDGTGMCGACRVKVAGEIKFACVHGPEFDAHEVDFDELINRLNMYKELEYQALEKYLGEKSEK